MGDDADKTNRAKVLLTRYNAGALPYFSGEVSNTGIRSLAYHKDNWVDKYPMIWCSGRLPDALEMNLFLEHRYRGKFRQPRHGGRANPFGGVTVRTLRSIAASLSLFLTWLSDLGIDWREVTASAVSDKAKYWLPVYRFRKHLIDSVVAKKLGRDTANLYMSHIRQFYEWARRCRKVDKLPFTYSNLTIKKPRADGDFDLLFSSHVLDKSLVVQTSDLSIPKKYRQKRLANDVLAPFSKEELSKFYATKYMAYPSRRLWADLALLAGLRAAEVATLPEGVIVNPFESDKNSFYANVMGKGNKEREVLIPRGLMMRLWEYLNSPERLLRAAKWDVRNSPEIQRPLFVNRSGNPIAVNSVCNITVISRRELSEKGQVLERSFHDLRSTYATNLAKFMLDHGLEGGFIEYKLMSLLGHSNFSTTRKYLNFARSVTFDKQMKGWTDTVFDGIEQRLQEEFGLMVGENNAQ